VISNQLSGADGVEGETAMTLYNVNEDNNGRIEQYEKGKGNPELKQLL
jgi:hypothetical protein